MNESADMNDVWNKLDEIARKTPPFVRVDAVGRALLSEQDHARIAGYALSFRDQCAIAARPMCVSLNVGLLRGELGDKSMWASVISALAFDRADAMEAERVKRNHPTQEK